MRRRHLAALAAATGFAAPAFAQTGTSTGATTAVPAVNGGGMADRLQAGQIRAKDLMERDVRSSDDANIGEVEDLIFDPATGRIAAVIIEVEGTLGIGGRYVALPLDRLRMDGTRRVIVSHTRDELRAMPAFQYRD